MARKKRAKAARRRKQRTGGSPERRSRIRLVVWILAASAGLFFLVPRIAAELVEDEVGDALGGRIDITTLRGWTGRRVKLGNVRWYARGALEPLLAARHITCELDRPLTQGLPERLEGLELIGVRWVWPPSPAATPPPLPVPEDAVRAEASPESSDAGPEELPAFLPRVIQVRHGRMDVRLGRSDSAFILPVTDVSATIRRSAPHRMEVAAMEGRLFGGVVKGDGSYDLRRPGRWRLQLRIAEVDLAEAAAGTSLRDSFTRGRLGAFIDLHGPDEPGGAPRGAGWISAAQSHVWQVPVFGGILDAFGLAAGHGDYFRRLRARFLLDEGVFHFEELVALGSPVSLYGNGSMDLDGRKIEADFVPRIGAGLLEELPFVGAPGQTLLDLFKGATLEVQLRGGLDDPRATVMPLPLITRPIQEFIALVGG